MNRKLAIVVAAGLVCSLAAGCRAGSPADATDGEVVSSPGITATEVLIGTTAPISGAYAVNGIYVQGAKAYFDHVNEQGGVEMADGKKRKIDFKFYDDAYDPARALSNCKQFAEQDQGFAMVLINGSPTGLACKDFLNQSKVPHPLHFSSSQVFSLGGADDLGTGFPLTYVTESAIIADIVKSNDPDARAAILKFDGEAGLEFANGFKSAVTGSGVQVVAEETYKGSDPSVNSQMSRILNEKPDVLLQFTAGKTISQVVSSLYGATPPVTDYLVSVGASTANLEPAGIEKANGVRAVVWAKDPSDPSYKDDKDVILFKELVSKYGEGRDLEISITAMYGFIGAQLVVDALERSEPNRDSFMEASRNFKDVKVAGLLPDVTANTGADDPFLIESGREKVFADGGWKLEKDLYSYEGRSPRP